VNVQLHIYLVSWAARNSLARRDFFVFNPNGESAISAAVAAGGKRAVTIGLGASLHAIDTLTPRLHEI
jgi:hypothetical protein